MVITVKIADITICVKSRYPIHIGCKKSYKNSLSFQKADIIIRVHYGKIPKFVLRNKDHIFGVEKFWNFYRLNGKEIYIFKRVKYKKCKKRKLYVKVLGQNKEPIGLKKNEYFYPRALKKELSSLYRVAVFDPGFKQGDIYFRKRQHVNFGVNSQHNPCHLLEPLAFPLLEILISKMLLLKRGIMFHACGIIDDNCGYVFVGYPGSGKSTIAKLTRNQVFVLNEDRIGVRKIGSDFWIYDAPYIGKVDSSRKAKLNKIFLIHHALKNRVTQQTGAHALFGLVPQTILPNYSRREMKFALDFCSQLIQKVPFYTLGFFPDEKVLGLIRKC